MTLFFSDYLSILYSFKLVAKQAGLCLTQSETKKIGILGTRLKSKFITAKKQEKYSTAKPCLQNEPQHEKTCFLNM